MKNIIQDTHECFNCGNEIEWEYVFRTGYFQVRQIVRAQAEICMIGKNTAEIKCRCPRCNMVNKFPYEI